MKKSAIDIALHFLKFRARSVFEIEKKLKEKNISEKEIKDTIRVLKRNELLNDEKFVKMYVKDRNNFKPIGSYLLRMELKKLGIDENLIEDVMVGQDDEELARRAIESKHRYRNADFPKQAQFLQRRGFGMGIIYKILNNKF